MSEPEVSLTLRVEQLAGDLREAQRQIDRLRRRQQATLFSVTLLALFTTTSATWGVSAQQAGLSGRVRAPFEVVDSAGKAVFRVIASGAPVGAGVVVTGGDGGARHGVYVLNQAGARLVAIGQSDSGFGSLQVRNAAGTNVFTVTDGAPSGAGVIVTGGEGGARQGVYVLNQSGAPVVSIGQAQGGHGALLLRDENAATRLRFEGNGSLLVADAAGKGILRIADKNNPADARITVGPNDGGRYAITISNASGGALATMGEARVGGGVLASYNTAGTIGAILSGTGQVQVANDAGQTLATMVAEKNQGAFSVRSASGTTIARVGEGTGGGLFQLANQAGNAMVEAGIHTSGVGLVRTFPIGSPGASFVGMPGTFLIGRAGGK